MQHIRADQVAGKKRGAGHFIKRVDTRDGSTDGVCHVGQKIGMEFFPGVIIA
jgi:hypothetical protein